jgi:hypothetical protein
MTLGDAEKLANTMTTKDDALQVAIEMLEHIQHGSNYGTFEYITKVERMKKLLAADEEAAGDPIQRMYADALANEPQDASDDEETICECGRPPETCASTHGADYCCDVDDWRKHDKPKTWEEFEKLHFGAEAAGEERTQAGNTPVCDCCGLEHNTDLDCTEVSELEKEVVLNRAREAQSAFWSVLAELEAVVGHDVDGVADLQDTSLKALLDVDEEAPAPDSHTDERREAADIKYREDMKDAGRGHLLP